MLRVKRGELNVMTVMLRRRVSNDPPEKGGI